MMSLALMFALIETVDTHGESPIATAMARPWAPDTAVTFFRASANFLFVFGRAGQSYVLRLTDAARRSPETIAAELSLLRRLAAAGVPVAAPAPALAGPDVVSDTFAVGTLHATAFERAPGTHLDAGELTPEQLRRWGGALGRLHRATAAIALPDRPTWRDQLAQVDRALGADEPVARQALAAVRAQLDRLPPATPVLIHGDFELDNLLWDGQELVAIDFDDCAYSWPMADVAAAVRDLFDDSVSQVDRDSPALHEFVAGYRAIQPLADAELQHLPLFLLLQHLILFGAVKQALGAETTGAEPSWGTALRERLAARLERYRAEFAAWTA